MSKFIIDRDDDGYIGERYVDEKGNKWLFNGTEWVYVDRKKQSVAIHKMWDIFTSKKGHIDRMLLLRKDCVEVIDGLTIRIDKAKNKNNSRCRVLIERRKVYRKQLVDVEKDLMSKGIDISK